MKRSCTPHSGRWSFQENLILKYWYQWQWMWYTLQLITFYLRAAAWGETTTWSWSVSQAKGPPTHRVLAWAFSLHVASSFFYAVHNTKRVDSPLPSRVLRFQTGHKATLQRSTSSRRHSAVIGINDKSISKLVRVIAHTECKSFSRRQPKATAGGKHHNNCNCSLFIQADSCAGDSHNQHSASRE